MSEFPFNVRIKKMHIFESPAFFFLLVCTITIAVWRARRNSRTNRFAVFWLTLTLIGIILNWAHFRGTVTMFQRLIFVLGESKDFIGSLHQSHSAATHICIKWKHIKNSFFFWQRQIIFYDFFDAGSFGDRVAISFHVTTFSNFDESLLRLAKIWNSNRQSDTFMLIISKNFSARSNIIINHHLKYNWFLLREQFLKKNPSRR